MAYKKTIVLGLDYDEFKQGIEDCNEQMKQLDNEFALAQSEMDDAANSSQALANRTKYLTDTIELQQKKVDLAKQKYEGLMNAQADTSRIERAQAEFMKEKEALNALQEELEETKIASSNLKENFAALMLTVTAIAGATMKAANHFADYSENIMTVSTNTHIATDTLQEWEYAAGKVGIGLDTVTGSVSKLVQSMASAKSGTGQAAEAFERLGVSFQTTNGEMKDSEMVFLRTIDALKKVHNETERDQLAMALFGESANKMTGFINLGSEGIAELGEEAHELGRILDEETLQKGNAFKDSMVGLQDALENVANNIGVIVVPMLTELFNAIASIPTPVLKTITVIVTTVATLVTLVKTIESAMTVGKSAMGIMKMLSGGFDVQKVKIAAIIALLVALAAAIAVVIGKGKDLNNTLDKVGNLAGGGSDKVGHNAGGTNAWRGGLTMVGEDGPELVNLPRGSRIYNNNEVKEMGNTVYNVSMNVDISRLRSMGDVIDAISGLSDSVQCG